MTTKNDSLSPDLRVLLFALADRWQSSDWNPAVSAEVSSEDACAAELRTALAGVAPRIEALQGAIDRKVAENKEYFERCRYFKRELDTAREREKAVEWILRDAAYKSPEQVGKVAERWLYRLRTAAPPEGEK